MKIVITGLIILLLSTRKEETEVMLLSRNPPKTTFKWIVSKIRQILNLFELGISSIYFRLLLQIAGIERNPGPVQLPPPIFDQSRIYGNLTPESCEFPYCHDEVFASCHCSKCAGECPLLCFKHYKDNNCPKNKP